MALPTSIDNINATLYALDRIKNERCSILQNTDKGVIFRNEDTKRIYPCPKGASKCLHGTCAITSKLSCAARSADPFDSVGDDIQGPPCPCGPTQICAKNKKCYNKKPYLEFRDKKCIYGNFILKRWCLFPPQRRKTSVPGVTNVKPFKYNEDTGKCEITKDYCVDSMRISYKLDDQGRPTCYSKLGQEIGELFVGETVFRGFKSSGYDPTKDKPQPSLLYENFAGPNVNLYLQNELIGFKEEELKKTYPEIFRKNGISFTEHELMNDKNKKRIYFIEKNSHLISKPLLETLIKNI